MPIQFHPGLPTSADTPFVSDHLAFATEIPIPREKKLTVVSCNMHGPSRDGADSGYNAIERDDAVYDKRRERLVAANIRYTIQQNADVLLIQEGDYQFIEQLQRALGGGWRTNPSSSEIKSSRHRNASSHLFMLYRIDRLQPVETKEEEKKTYGGSNQKVKFKVLPGDSVITIHNTHWQHREYPQEAEAQLTSLLEEKGTVAVIGDFNNRIVDDPGRSYLINNVVSKLFRGGKMVPDEKAGREILEGGVQGADFTDGGFINDADGKCHQLKIKPLNPDTGKPYEEIIPPSNPMPKLMHPIMVAGISGVLSGSITSLILMPVILMTTLLATWPATLIVLGGCILGGIIGGLIKWKLNNDKRSSVPDDAKQQWNDLTRQRPFISLAEEHSTYGKAFSEETKTLLQKEAKGVYVGASTDAFNHKMVAILCSTLTADNSKLLQHLGRYFITSPQGEKQKCFHNTQREITSELTDGYQLFIPLSRVKEAEEVIKNFFTPVPAPVSEQGKELAKTFSPTPTPTAEPTAALISTAAAPASPSATPTPTVVPDEKTALLRPSKKGSN